MKGCINYISSRHLCIEHSLKSLWDNYNKKHNYPVYVYYFDDVYDSEIFRKDLKSEFKRCKQDWLYDHKNTCKNLLDVLLS